MRVYTKYRVATGLLIGLLTFSVCFSFSPLISENTALRSTNVNNQDIQTTSPINNERSSFGEYIADRDSASRSIDWLDRLASSRWEVDRPEPTAYEFETPEFSFGTPHEIIVITSNAGFGLYGFSGDGSPSTPYQINDLEITANSTHAGISISNTDAFFVISDCVIDGDYNETPGIELNSVQNALIYNNTCLNSGIGILLNGSDGLSVGENDIYSMSRAGIYLDQSDSNYIWDNFAVDGWDGIFLERSSSNDVTDNLCSGNQWGINLYWESDSNTIFNNTVVGNIAEGIILTLGCSQNTIELNYLEDNDGVGIYIEDSNDNDVIDNYCIQNYDEIILNRANDNLLERNTIILTKGSLGILLEGANFTIVRNNSLLQIEAMIVAIGCVSNTIVDNNCTSFLGGIILATCSDCLVDSNLCNGMDGEDGIVVYESLGANTVFNNNCTESFWNIHLEDANDTIIEENDCSGGNMGIYVYQSYNASVLHNTLHDNLVPGEGFYNIMAEESPYCTISENNCTGVPDTGDLYGNIYCVVSPHSMITDNFCNYGTDGVYLAESSHSTVTGNEIRFTEGYGIGVEASNSCLISHNTISNHTDWSGWEGEAIPTGGCFFSNYTYNTMTNVTYGFRTDSLFECAIADNVISESGYTGMELSNCADLTIERNSVEFNFMFGISTSSCDRCVFSRNTIHNASTGLFLWGDNCTLEYNRIHDTTTGMEFEDGVEGALVTNNTLEENIRGVVTHMSYVTVVWNIFIQNGQNAWVEFNLTQIIFDYNYWSDYTGGDADGDGIGDTPYETYYATNPEYDMHPLVYIPTPPMWLVEPFDEYLEYGTALSQQVSVSTPGQIAPVHMWWINSSGVFSISATGLIASPEFLPIGQYGIEVRAYNVYGIYVSGTLTVTVNDTIAPTLSSPADFSFAEGSTGITLNWTATDLGPASYSVSLDGTVIKSGTWNASGEIITINCDDLEAGVHTYTITITDLGGNSASDSVTVTVTEPELPLDATLLLIIAAGAGGVIIVLIIIMMKKRSGAE